MSETATDEVEHEFVFYIYDDEQDSDDPRFSFWLETSDGNGMSLYERLPDGKGMWLKPSEGSDYGAVEPTSGLKNAVADLVSGGQVATQWLTQLPSHEQYFVQTIHGTVEENPDAIPDPVWGWMHDCAEEVADG